MDNQNLDKESRHNVLTNYAMKILKDIIEDIKNGECDDDDLASALQHFNPEAKGYVKETDFVNYDEACVMLGIGWNRNKLNELCKKHKIRNRKMNNMPIGFPKIEILKLKHILEKEEKEKKKK